MSPNHLSGSWRGVLLVALGFLPACGGNASGGAAGGTDAAPAVEDAGRPTADSTSPTTDAAPTPDATPTPDANSPDGAPPPTHDAAIPPAPDAAMPPPPDAATPPTPDAATPPAEIHVAINEIDCHGRDWVELYNLAETPAILDGYGLSDRPDDPTRAYLLPLDTVVPPGGFLAIRQSAGGAGFTFGIGCGGGDAVALLDPAGATVDTVTLPDLPDRDAWGRLPDGTGDWARTDPTRGAANVPGPLAGADYFNPEGRNVIEIQLPPASLDSLNAEPYVYQPGRIRIGNGTGNPTGWLDVGVHIKGRAGSFRPLTGKSALRIDLNRQVAGQTLDGDHQSSSRWS